MSVINKMLRDLDRGATDARWPDREPPVLSVVRGTASVARLPGAPVRQRDLPKLAGWLLLLGIVVGGAWWGTTHLRSGAALSPHLSAPAAAVVAGPTAALPTPPGAMARVPAGPSAPITPASPLAPTAPVLGDVAPAPYTPDAVAAGIRQARAVAAAADAPAQPGAAQNKAPVQTPALQLSSPVPGPVPVPVPVLPRAAATLSVANVPDVTIPRQDAAIPALAQGQRLWAAGSRDAAINLLTEALQVLERSHGPELVGAGAGSALALVRELVRMELAQGQPDAVLVLLKQHERLLAGQADLWALRGNAAQRVGQHGQASQAYLAALKIRPGEPRWLLGAAVSLAASGQLAAAGELAETARSLGAASPDVLAYLRQLGVPLQEP